MNKSKKTTSTPVEPLVVLPSQTQNDQPDLSVSQNGEQALGESGGENQPTEPIYSRNNGFQQAASSRGNLIVLEKHLGLIHHDFNEEECSEREQALAKVKELQTENAKLHSELDNIEKLLGGMNDAI